jgi:hypothetical protein
MIFKASNLGFMLETAEIARKNWVSTHHSQAKTSLFGGQIVDTLW